MKEKTYEDYERKIIELHVDRMLDPGNEVLKKELEGQIRPWSQRIPITVQVAPNEKVPWGESEIGYPTSIMPSKKECGIKEVGDYMAFIPSKNLYCTTLIERKGGTKKDKRRGMWGAEDLYGTFMSKERRERFEREHERFKTDPRFKNGKIILIAECTLEDFLIYVPPFNGRNRNKSHVSASVNSRLGTIASLYERGIPVLFAGSRKRATELYFRIIQQNLQKNYFEYLGLKPISHIVEEDSDALERC